MSFPTMPSRVQSNCFGCVDPQAFCIKASHTPTSPMLQEDVKHGDTRVPVSLISSIIWPPSRLARTSTLSLAMFHPGRL